MMDPSMSFYHLNQNEQNLLINYRNEKNVFEIWMPGKRFTEDMVQFIGQ